MLTPVDRKEDSACRERKTVLTNVDRKEDSACRERKTVLTHVDRKEDSANRMWQKGRRVLSNVY